ncbi:MAG: cation diffusion facilitator family transporter [Paludibacter sp.]|jgi:cobalt-zinc-cadmium efflux system protein|nr:cation diffusion facilitator family transporter [Paludibacter sp.]
MYHNHSHSHSHNTDIKNIKLAFFLNFGFTIFEIIGGLFTNSIAIMSDAIHDLGDSLSLALAWYFQKFSKRGRNNSYSYGYKRFSLLGAMINSIVLVAGSVFVLSEAIPRLFSPAETKVEGMFVMAIIGVLVNGAAVFRLKKGNSINERVVSLHLLEDVLGWLAVLIGSVVMYFFDLPIIDPLLSLGIAVFILSNVYKNVKQSLQIFLQAVPDKVDLQQITDLLEAKNEIVAVHDLHIWSVDGELNILTVHIVLAENFPPNEIICLKTEIRQLLKNQSIQHSTIEFELENEKCGMEDCV